MSTLNEHEEAFCRVFVRAEKRRRCGELLAHPKRRREILDRLNHGADVDLSRARLIPRGERTVQAVEGLLRERAAPATCHVIACALELDGCEVPLRKALESAVTHDFAIVLSCLPGRLALYKPEAPEDWYLLEHDLPGSRPR
ncbi:MAG: hypothetical protein ACK47B_19375 [Armatimonadota bacterium]